MKDDFEILFYISIILSIIGILLLTYTFSLINPPLKNIEEISYADIEKNVYVEGKIKEIKKLKDNSTILRFYNTTVEIYLPRHIQINFEKGKNIRALGVVKIYQGRLEIIVRNTNDIEIIENRSFIGKSFILAFLSYFLI